MASQTAAADASESVFRDNSRLRQKLAEKVAIDLAYATAHLDSFYLRHISDHSFCLCVLQELDIARLHAMLSLSEGNAAERQRQAGRVKDLQESLDALMAQLEEANRKLAFQEKGAADERKKLVERARVAGDKERVAHQQVEILEETLHLHRKRVSKQYKKIDGLQV